MFGFLAPSSPLAGYSSAYARLCQHHRLHKGLLALPTHSYEAVFLFQLAVDLGLVDGSIFPAARCCRLKRLPEDVSPQEAKAGEFCSHSAMLLVDVKLADDEADDGSRLARWARRLWQRPIEESRKFFGGLDPSFESRLAAIFKRQKELESAPPGEVGWQAALAPTSEAFGYLFSLICVHLERADLQPFFQEVGGHIGAAIVAFDMAWDLPGDRRSGSFNPLVFGGDAMAAYDACIRNFATAADKIQDGCKAETQTCSAALLREVAAGILSIRNRHSAAGQQKPSCLETHGLSLSQHLREGRVLSDPCGAVFGCLLVLGCVGCVGKSCGGDYIKTTDSCGREVIREKSCWDC